MVIWLELYGDSEIKQQASFSPWEIKILEKLFDKARNWIKWGIHGIICKIWLKYWKYITSSFSTLFELLMMQNYQIKLYSTEFIGKLM